MRSHFFASLKFGVHVFVTTMNDSAAEMFHMSCFSISIPISTHSILFNVMLLCTALFIFINCITFWFNEFSHYRSDHSPPLSERCSCSLGLECEMHMLSMQCDPAPFRPFFVLHIHTTVTLIHCSFKIEN